MKTGRRVACYIIYAVLGAVLVALTATKTVDEFWGGMGTALIFMSVIRFVQLYRFNKSDEYRQKVQTEINDERNRFIRSRAWAVAGYLFVIVSAVSTIVFRVLGKTELSDISAIAICFIVGVYWIAYIIISKKY